jgi:hypothetical protein
VSLEAEDGHCAEENNDGQRGDESGKNEAASGVVALCPVERGGIGFEEVDEGGDEGEEGDGFEKAMASRARKNACDFAGTGLPGAGGSDGMKPRGN